MSITQRNANPGIHSPARCQPMVAFLAALACGILGDRYATQPLWVCISVGLGSLGLWLIAWKRGSFVASSLSLFVAVGGWAAARHHTWWHYYAEDEIGVAATDAYQPICLEAVATSIPRAIAAPPEDLMRTKQIGDRTVLEIRVSRVRNGSTWQSASGITRLSIDGQKANIQPGDRLRILGDFRKPPLPANPGEPSIAERRRTERQLFLMVCSHPDCVTVIEKGSVWRPTRILGTIRQRCHTQLWAHLQHRQAELAAAVLLGARDQLEFDRTEAFFLTGTIHLLAISGLHVGILAFGFWWFVRLLPLRRKASLLLVAAFVILYSLLTDARPPVIRATILICVLCGGRLYGRQSLSLNSLAVAGILILSVNPAQLFQVGTQLSFLAVATIAFAVRRSESTSSVDPLQRLIDRSRPWWFRTGKQLALGLWKFWWITSVIWLVALPLTMYRFHLFSPIALVINPIVWLPIALALFAGFGVLIFGWLIPPLGDACGMVCDRSLLCLESVVGLAQQIDGAYGWTSGPRFWWVVATYIGLGLACMAGRWRPSVRWALVLLVIWIATGVLTSKRWMRSMRQPADTPVVVTFVSVGHGTSVIIEIPTGQVILYDSGRLGSPILATRAVSSTLWYYGIEHLDAIVISHADADHYNAIPSLLERFSCDEVRVTPFMFNQSSRSVAALRDSIKGANVPIEDVWDGKQLLANELTADAERETLLRVLHPPFEGMGGSDNANSIVLHIDSEFGQILLPGDLEQRGMRRLMAGAPIDCDVVMAPHHGSARSNPRDFTAWCTPELLVISSGDHAEELRAVDEFRQAGADVMATADSGAIRIEAGGSGLDIRGWRERPW